MFRNAVHSVMISFPGLTAADHTLYKEWSDGSLNKNGKHVNLYAVRPSYNATFGSFQKSGRKTIMTFSKNYHAMP